MRIIIINQHPRINNPIKNRLARQLQIRNLTTTIIRKPEIHHHTRPIHQLNTPKQRSSTRTPPPRPLRFLMKMRPVIRTDLEPSPRAAWHFDDALSMKHELLVID